MTEYLVTYRNVMQAGSSMDQVGPERQMVFNVPDLPALFAEMREYERVVVDVVEYDDSVPAVHATPRPAATNTPYTMTTATRKPTKAEVLGAIAEFLVVLDANTAEYFAEHYSILQPPTHGYEKGRRFVKITREDAGYPAQGQRFVECFVDMTNGDVIKSAGWTGPQRDRNGNLAVRYNLFDARSKADLFAKAGKVSGYLYER
jgi:hypothetical protein